MSLRANADLSSLRQQLSGLQPGRVADAAETAAPFLAKALGYADVIGSILRQIPPPPGRPRPARDALERHPVPPPRAEFPPPPPPPRRPLPWFRWRWPVLSVLLLGAGGLAAYGLFRTVPLDRRRRRAPPG